ncbi:MAG: NAD(P)-binding protein [Deltaproteobacteria bacterium]|nr:MAG: NAD(P)-binding protein [Deltaproteobacteria bacterium]
MGEKINILGAGLSGMVAAIDLARQGYEVTVLDRAARIGGSETLHPSVHGTPVKKERTWNYVGIDLSPCFHPVQDVRFYYGSNGYRIPPDGIYEVYAVERGNRESSLDSFIYQKAQEADVRFEFSRDIKSHRELPAGSIIASGLFPEMYDSLKVPYVQVHCYMLKFETDKPTEVVAYFDDYIGDYYYHGIVNGIFFGLLFQRMPFPRDALKRCQEFLEEREGLTGKDWKYINVWVPIASIRNPRLFAEDKILAGTISGMMDPMMLFGIVGAILSGKIAALAVYNREQAVKDFKYYNRNWRRNYINRRIFERLPFRVKIMEWMTFSGSERMRRSFLQSGKLAIPGVESYPVIKNIEKL